MESSPAFVGKVLVAKLNILPSLRDSGPRSLHMHVYRCRTYSVAFGIRTDTIMGSPDTGLSLVSNHSGDAAQEGIL